MIGSELARQGRGVALLMVSSTPGWRRSGVAQLDSVSAAARQCGMRSHRADPVVKRASDFVRTWIRIRFQRSSPEVQAAPDLLELMVTRGEP